MKELLVAINELEEICLANDCQKTTIEQLEKSDKRQIEGYYQWLCQNTTSFFHHKPFGSFSI